MVGVLMIRRLLDAWDRHVRLPILLQWADRLGVTRLVDVQPEADES